MRRGRTDVRSVCGAIVVTAVLCATVVVACLSKTTGGDPDAGHQLPDAAGVDGSTVDGAVDSDAGLDARPVPPDTLFSLPDSSADAFVHPTSGWGPAQVVDTLVIPASAHSISLFAAIVNPEIEASIANGSLLLVIEFLDLDDQSGVIDDPDVTLVIYYAQDADWDPSNNFTGFGHFLVDLENAVVIPNVAIVGGQISVPAGTFPLLAIDIAGFGLMALTDPALDLTVQDDLAGLTDGFVEGAVLGRSLDAIPNQTTIGNPNGSILDMLVTSIFEMQPDVDIDGDGHLESYEDTTPLSPAIDEVISICHDLYGDLEYAGCAQHAWMWDGFSAAVELTAVPCVIDGSF